MKKTVVGVLATMAMSVIFASAAWAGWDWDGGESRWYYSDPESGERLTGWQEVDGAWYYLEPENNGAMHTGWLDLNNKRYFCDLNTGKMKKNEVFCTCNEPAYGDGFLYQVDGEGALITKGESANPKDPDEMIIYCNDGKLKLKDSVTIGAGIATGSTYYQYVLCDHYKNIQYGQNEEDIRNGIIENTELYNDRYIRRVKGASYKVRQERLEKWKASVARKLSQLKVEQEWIEKYYQDVQSGKFENGDEWVDYMERKMNGDWTGDYEDDDEEWD